MDLAKLLIHAADLHLKDLVNYYRDPIRFLSTFPDSSG